MTPAAHPLLAYLDRGDERGGPLAGILRPGNAAANNAADHIPLLELALAQLPTSAHHRLLVRTDSAARPAPCSASCAPGAAVLGRPADRCPHP